MSETLSGKSGSTVVRDGEFVFKTGRNVQEEYAWYKKARDYVAVPAKVSTIGIGGLRLTYVHNDPVATMVKRRGAEKVAASLLVIADLVSKIPADSMIDAYEAIARRINDHAAVYPDLYDAKKMDKLTQTIGRYNNQLNTEQSFSHGDYSVDNVLWGKNGIVLIDPIYKPELYGSARADIAKYVASILVRRTCQEYKKRLEAEREWLVANLLIDDNDSNKELFQALVAYQLIRVVKYREKPEHRKALAKLIGNLI